MTFEPHPYPERAFWRVAPPVAAAALAGVNFVVMVAVPPNLVQTVALVLLLLAQVVLMAARGLVLRRSARVADRFVYWHQFFFAWSFWTGGTYLLSGYGAPADAAILIGTGLPFAVLFVLVLGASSYRPRARQSRRDGT